MLTRACLETDVHWTTPIQVALALTQPHTLSNSLRRIFGSSFTKFHKHSGSVKFCHMYFDKLVDFSETAT